MEVEVPDDFLDSDRWPKRRRMARCRPRLNFLRKKKEALAALGVKVLSRVDVVEMYSPERVVPVAVEKGLMGGASLDLLTGWDFRNKLDRDLAWRYIKEHKPRFVIGSPMCTAYSVLQNLNRGRSEEQDKALKQKRTEADRHMQFMMKVYELQMAEGRYFLHEHPKDAES